MPIALMPAYAQAGVSDNWQNVSCAVTCHLCRHAGVSFEAVLGFAVARLQVNAVPDGARPSVFGPQPVSAHGARKGLGVAGALAGRLSVGAPLLEQHGRALKPCARAVPVDVAFLKPVAED